MKNDEDISSFTDLSRDSDKVEFKIVLLGDTDQGGEGSEDQRIGILEETDPLLSSIEPLLGVSRVINKSMDITMSMWLGFDFEAVGLLSEVSLGVKHSRDLFLLHEGDLVLGHSEIVILFKKLDSSIMGIIRCHDGKKDLVFIS